MNKITGAYTEENWFGEVTFDGEILTPHASLEVANHSPDGFAWGYWGSGPSQLGLAILLATGMSGATAMRHYSAFTSRYIATLDRRSFVLEVDIPKWVEEHEVVIAKFTGTKTP